MPAPPHDEPTSPPALRVADLTKRYPTGTEALRGVSLDIPAGGFFGLLGPNGAGKSTLIHCTTGLVRPTSGAIEVFGHDALQDYEEARAAVGLAPQDLNLDWFLTLEETLDYHGGCFGMPRRERRARADELLETFSLGDKRRDRSMTPVRRHEAAADPRAGPGSPRRARAASSRRATASRRSSRRTSCSSAAGS